MQQWGAFVQQLVQCKSNENYTAWMCIFVALFIQNAAGHIVICGLPRSAIFFHIIS
jgi:hypothetical protein